MMRPGFPLTNATIFAGITLGVAAVAAAINSPEQDIVSGTSFPPGVDTHETHGEWTPAVQAPNATETAVDVKAVSSAPPTRSSFMASWARVNGAIRYLLDVSTDRAFGSYVNGYHDLDVGNVTGRVVTGLNPGTTYYYRVHAYGASGSRNYSEVGS